MLACDATVRAAGLVRVQRRAQCSAHACGSARLESHGYGLSSAATRVGRLLPPCGAPTCRTQFGTRWNRARRRSSELTRARACRRGAGSARSAPVRRACGIPKLWLRDAQRRPATAASSGGVSCTAREAAGAQARALSAAAGVTTPADAGAQHTLRAPAARRVHAAPEEQARNGRVGRGAARARVSATKCRTRAH